MGREGGDSEKTQEEGEEDNIKTTVCSRLGPETLPYMGWHSSNLSGPWSGSELLPPRTIPVLSRMRLSAHSDSLARRPASALLYLLLPCKHKRPFTAEV